MDTLLQDLRLALRGLRRSPGFALAAIGTLALALGLNATLFSVVDAVLIEALPYDEPDRVVFLEHRYPSMLAAASPPLFLDYRREARTFESVAASRPWRVNLTGRGDPERLRGLMVSAGFFDVLGARAALGRTFVAGEDDPGQEHVVVVSHALWQSHLGGDRAVLGATLQLDGTPHRIVGVMPAGFRWGRGWGRETRGDVWAPFALTPDRIGEDNRGNEYLDLYARLAPGVTVEQSAADLEAVSRGLSERFPGRYGPAVGWRVRPVPIQDALVGDLTPILVLLQGAVLVLLLITASNVSGLLLARAASRRRESSVRAALGADRGRLVRQQLTESAVLTVLATVAGLGLALLATRFLDAVDPTLLPRMRTIGLDGSVVLFTVGVAALAAAVCGLAPAWHAGRTDLMAALRGTGASPAREGGPLRARRAFVVGQVALTTALLVATGLLVASVARLDAVVPGFEKENRLALSFSLSPARYGEPAARIAFFDELLERVRALPGATGAAAMSHLPLSGDTNSSSFEIEGRESVGPEPGPHAESWAATPGYFQTMGIPVVSGRRFSIRDGAGRPDVVVVNEALAERYFAGRDPVDQRIDVGGGGSEPRWRKIVGVVGDVHGRALEQEPRPQFYVPYAQRPFREMSIVVRTRGEALSLVGEVRAALRSVDPSQPVSGVTTVERIVSAASATRRTLMRAIGAFALGAILLASLGLYGVLAYSVRERTAEVGVRKALGARTGHILGLFLWQGARLILPGLVLGAALAAVSGRLVEGLLYEVTSFDPGAYVGATALLAGVGLLACAAPAWRAARLDPARALRDAP